jgi:hypothetical protein
MSRTPARAGSAARDTPIRVRLCRPADRAAVAALGHAPAVVAALCPTAPMRLAWSLGGTAARGFLAENRASGAVVGSIQFVRSRREPETWMFGHWRVIAARRREGIGRLLLREGAGLLGEVRRLYSYVDWGNEVSRLAHEHLGFEASPQIRGSAPLGGLSTIGPATPGLRLEFVPRRERAGLFDLYRRAAGDLWSRLFPHLGPDSFLASGFSDGNALPAPTTRLLGITRVWTVRPMGAAAGFILWRGSSITVYVDPVLCGAALLAQVAMKLMAIGARREQEIALVGLRDDHLSRPGPIAPQVLMGMPDTARLA